MLQVAPDPQAAAADQTLLAQVETVLRRWLVLSDKQFTVVALWIIHTHAVQSFDQTPYLAITSPDKQCGKSRLLEVLELLVPEPWQAITPSEAVFYRYINAYSPT